MINASLASYGDLRRYNTIIVPSGQGLDDSSIGLLTEWIKQGGTLIAHNYSTRSIIDENGIANVKHLSNTLDKSDDYNLDLQREIYSLDENINKEKTNDNNNDNYGDGDIYDNYDDIYDNYGDIFDNYDDHGNKDVPIIMSKNML
jgi:hypothetical protein